MDLKTVFLVDDHAILLDGLTNLLDKEDDLKIIGTATNAEDALIYLKDNKVDLLITDQNLPGMDGLELIKQTRSLYPQIKVIMLSMHDESDIIRSVLSEGVDGYVLKKDSHFELKLAIQSVFQNEVYLSKGLNKILISALDQNVEKILLTEREKEILIMITNDLSTKEIAEKLHISSRTVESHRKNLLRKTGSNSVVGLVNYAYKTKLI